MKKLFLFVVLIFFLQPILASAEPIMFGCECVKHNHKNGNILGFRLSKEQKQCPSVKRNFYIDNEEMVVYGDFWAGDENKFLDKGEWIYEKYSITENKNNKLSASHNSLRGARKIDIIKNNDKFKIATFWDSKPKKKEVWVERTYNCKIVSSKIGILN